VPVEEERHGFGWEEARVGQAHPGRHRPSC
jgi:hypothetical protein